MPVPPVIELQLYRTRVVDGIVTADSELVTIRITDADGDGIIDTKEWTDATGSPPGFLRGTVADSTQPAIWSGDGGSLKTGYIYTDVPYTSGTNIQPLVNTLVQNKFEVRFDELNICFLAGTLIATPDGQRRVEDLRKGDLVLTRDHGPQPLVWVGQSVIGAARLDVSPNLRPIRIGTGAMDGTVPNRPLRVSAQHRMLVTDADGAEHLVAAAHLAAAGVKGVTVMKSDQDFTLIHIACAAHEVIEAEGAATESFYTGRMAMRGLSKADRQELFAIFPGLEDGENPMTPARPFVKKKDVMALLGAKADVSA